MEQNKEIEYIENKDLDSILEDLCGSEEAAKAIVNIAVV